MNSLPPLLRGIWTTSSIHRPAAVDRSPCVLLGHRATPAEVAVPPHLLRPPLRPVQPSALPSAFVVLPSLCCRMNYILEGPPGGGTAGLEGKQTKQMITPFDECSHTVHPCIAVSLQPDLWPWGWLSQLTCDVAEDGDLLPSGHAVPIASGVWAAPPPVPCGAWCRPCSSGTPAPAPCSNPPRASAPLRCSRPGPPPTHRGDKRFIRRVIIQFPTALPLLAIQQAS